MNMPDEDRRAEDRVQRERLSVNQAQRDAERNLERIDDEEKPRARSDQLELRQRDREAVDREDRPGGVGQHRRAAGNQADRPREPLRVRHVAKPLWLDTIASPAEPSATRIVTPMIGL